MKKIPLYNHQNTQEKIIFLAQFTDSVKHHNNSIYNSKTIMLKFRNISCGWELNFLHNYIFTTEH